MKKLKKVLSNIIMICVLLSTVVIQPNLNVQAVENNNIILPKNAEWKYMDNGIDLGTAWHGKDYDDSVWKKGKAPLGYGDDFSETDLTLPIGTIVDYGNAENKNMTTYLRTTVNASDLTKYKTLEVYVHADDGAVVYINGVEAFRRGIDNGVDVNFNTTAKFKPKEEIFQIPVSTLKEGLNTISAEVHQDGPTSSDLWFEMSIKGSTGEPTEEPSGDNVVIPDPNAPIGTISKVTMTFFGDTTTSKGFTWYSTLASGDSDLQVVEKTASEPDFNKATSFLGKYNLSTNSPSEVVHKAEATGLKADTSYFFRAGDAKLGIWSDVGTFKTAAKDGAFTFVDIADTQAKTEEEAMLSSETIAKALETVSNASFLALNGDIVDTGMNELQWNWMFGHSKESLLNTTLAPASGNHEEDKNAFIDHFNIDAALNSSTTSGAYYSYNYSNAHFIVLNNNEDSQEYADFTPTQIQWLKDDVTAAKAAGAKWIIVNMHKGPYTTSNHATDGDIMGENGVRTKVAPIIAELGIDFVLQGHDHIYARTKPIKNGTASDTTKITETYNGETIEYTVNPDGTIYLIPATAGPKTYYRNKKIDPSYYDLFEVADENHAAVYGPEPSDPSRPVRSQIQNFESITIDGEKLSVVSYEIDQSKNNGQPYIIDKFGIIKTDENHAAAYKIIESLSKAEEGSTQKVELDKISGIAIGSIFEAIKGKDINVNFVGNGVNWNFNGKKINEKIKDIDLNVEVADLKDSKSVNKDAIIEATKGKTVKVISFGENGILPGEATVTVNLGAELAGKTNLFIYYFNPTTKEIEKIAGPLTADVEGNVTFTVTHNSDYVVLNGELNVATIETAMVNTNATVANVTQTGSTINIYPLVIFGLISLIVAIAVSVVPKRLKYNKDK